MRSKLVYAGRGALSLLTVLVVAFGLQFLIRGRVPNSIGIVIVGLVVFATYLAAVRWIERRQAIELAAQKAVSELAAGLLLGILLFSTVMLLLWIIRVYRPSGQGSVAPLPVGLIVALAGATVEEILFRGLLFRLIAKLGGPWIALLVTSLLFGAAHALNPGATVWSSAAIALEAGVLLGAAYASTQRLWLPIGLHMGWNFTEGSVFGMSVSGGNTRTGLISGTLQGPNLFTGGKFGPEASLIAVAVCLAAASYFLWRLVRFETRMPQA